jgi:hypothetical protein
MAARTTKDRSAAVRRSANVRKPAAPRRASSKATRPVRSPARPPASEPNIPTPPSDWQAALMSLQAATESLQAVQASFADALFHMPRASEYEPLVDPLRQFARLVTPLSEHLTAWPRVIAELKQQAPRVALAPAPPSPTPGLAARAAETLHEVAQELDTLRTQLVAALDTLPSAEEYTPVAQQLRELASVSPSLLEWMEEVPRLSAPLSHSVDGLRDSADRLEQLAVRVRLAAGLLAEDG